MNEDGGWMEPGAWPDELTKAGWGRGAWGHYWAFSRVVWTWKQELCVRRHCRERRSSEARAGGVARLKLKPE
jgi:hypothetical protein